MQFQLISVLDQVCDSNIVTIYMTFNGRTYNCTNSIHSFKDAKSAKATLMAVINELITHCYAENKIDGLKEELKGLDEKRIQLINIINEYE